MGIFSRFMDIVNSNINALLDKAEDPEKMLRLMIQEMEDTLIELKSNCSSIMADGIRKQKRMEECEKALTRWENRAVLAIEKGREDLAREAIIEKRNILSEIESLKKAIAENLSSADEAKKEIDTLETKLKETREKLKSLKEKKERAEMERKASSAQRSRTSDYFSQMEEKIDRMSAYNDLNKKENRSENKFKAFEEDEEIEKELEALKKRAKE